VVVVGSVNVDLVVRTPRLPNRGETVTGGRFEQHDGGKGGNQAVAAARLGRPTLFVGAVGDDPFGPLARTALARAGVDVSGLRMLRDQSTGVALILVDEHGENLISVASGANALLDAGSVEETLSRLGSLRGDVVLVSHEIPTTTVRETLRLARTAGARTVLNPAPALGLDRSTFELADIVVPNRGELATLAATETRRPVRTGGAGADPVRLARSLMERNAKGDGVAEAVLVTVGASGAILLKRSAPDEAVEIPALKVDSIDTTGAGDAFCGALAAARAEGRELEEAVSRAIAAGGLATLKVGAREGMPSTAELDAVLAG
jgi:ribokinase